MSAELAAKHNSVVYYDGECRLCGILVWGLSKADMFRRKSWKRIVWTPYQSLDEPPHGLSWDDLQRAAYLVEGDGGSLYEGYYAFRMLALRLPMLAPLAPALWFPGTGALGRALYRWVARNRSSIFGCHTNYS